MARKIAITFARTTPGWDTIDYGTAEEEQHSFHLKGFTPEEERQVFAGLKLR